MKINLISTALLVFLILWITAHPSGAQVAFQGEVMSRLDNTALRDATITITDLNGKEIGGPVYTNEKGEFKIEKILGLGTKVLIKIKKRGFIEEAPAEHTINKREAVNKVRRLTLQPLTIISGFVTDSLTGLAIPGAEIFFYDDQGRLIVGGSGATDPSGYFDFETDFTSGRDIQVRADKKDYIPKEVEKTIRDIGRLNKVEIKLQKIEDKGVKVTLRVYDRKRQKPLEGVTISWSERKKTPKTAVTPPNGEIPLNIFQVPGSRLDLRLQKTGYFEIKPSPVLAPDRNLFDYYLEKERHFPWCPCILGLSGVSALGSGGLFLASKSTYKQYKSDISKDTRDKATGLLRASVATGSAAVLSLVAWKWCKKIKERNTHDRTLRERAVQPYGFRDGSGNGHLGIAYHF